MTTNHPYDLQKLWDKTDNGLIFFQDEFATAISENRGSIKGFRVRSKSEDKTGSCHISNKGTTLYHYRDWGTMDKGINAIDFVMQRDNCDFAKAANTLFKQYNIEIAALQFDKPISKLSTDTKHKIGYWKAFEFAKIQDEKYFRKIVPFYTEDLLTQYNFKELKSYENNGQKEDGSLWIKTVTATADYPIYGYVNKEFCKTYQPKAYRGKNYPDGSKNFDLKHGFIGQKPPRFIYGWDRLFAMVNIEEINDCFKRLKDKKGSYIDEGSDWSNVDETNSDNKDKLKQLNELKLDSVIICTGGSDGMNIASLGYNVIWFNSETEIINNDELYQLQKICKTVYYLPDLDKTGVAQAVKMGMLSKNHLKIKIIWLPEWLKLERKKDAADWVRKFASLYNNIEKVKAMFAQLVLQALEFQFWEWNPQRGQYSLNNKIMLYFLKYNGYYLNRVVSKSADSQNEIEKTRIVYIEKNIVKPVSPRQVKNFVLQWLDENFIDIKVYNMILKSVYFSESALLSLPEIKIDTKTATAESQLYFFRNKVAKITADKIEALEYSAVDNLVWQNDIIEHDLQLQKPFFNISKDDNENWKLDILSNDSNYLKVLINTSRMFWEKDADAITGIDTNNFSINSKNLSDDENLMQQLQLINKIYTVGYILHKYKIKQKAFFTLGVDNKNGLSTKESNGRSGKSFIQDVLKCFLKNWKDKNGKLLPKENQQFIYDKVTSNTDYMLFDDLHEYQDYNFFFAVVTGSLEANHKGGDIHDIPFEDSPKLGATTNFAPSNLSASLQGRLLVYYVSDYYHQKTEDNGYQFTRQISDDFGNKTILDKNYPAEQWQNDYNFMLQCLQFYLSQNEKIDAPMEGLIIKNLRQIIGDAMLKFCEEYFLDTTNLNNWIYKKDMFDYYREEIGSKAKSSQRFKDDLILFCKTKKWTIEFKKKRVDTGGKSVEHFYINTTNAPIVNENELVNENDTQNKPDVTKPSDDLPF